MVFAKYLSPLCNSTPIAVSFSIMHFFTGEEALISTLFFSARDVRELTISPHPPSAL